MEVKFERLHFGYNRKREILHGIDLNLPSNKFIAVLGPKAAAKPPWLSKSIEFCGHNPVLCKLAIDRFLNWSLPNWQNSLPMCHR